MTLLAWLGIIAGLSLIAALVEFSGIARFLPDRSRLGTILIYNALPWAVIGALITAIVTSPWWRSATLVRCLDRLRYPLSRKSAEAGGWLGSLLEAITFGIACLTTMLWLPLAKLKSKISPSASHR